MKIVILLIFININLLISATISGIIKGTDGEPLAAASVRIEGTKYGAIADKDGKFVIRQIPSGNYLVKASMLGFLSIVDEINLSEDEKVNLNFTLQNDALNLQTVVVSGTRDKQDRENNPVVVSVLDDKLFNATQSIAISEGLNFQPGVRVESNCQNCGFTQVRLNGLDGAYSQILINSRPIFSALNSVYGLDQIPTNIVEQVEVVRSGGSALYGSNAIGGTVNIITKDPIENSWEARSNTALIAGDALDQTFNINGSIVNESLTSGFTFYGMSRNRESYDANDDGFTELVELENAVFGGKAFYKPNEYSKVTLDFSALKEYRRGGDRLNLAPHFTDISEELDHNTFFGGFNYEHWSENRKNKFNLYGSTQSTERASFYGGLGGGRTAEDSILARNAYGGTEDLALVAGFQYNRYFDNDILTVGVENQNYDTKDEIQGYDRLIDQQVSTSGLFAQYEWKPLQKFTALLGARYDISNVNGDYRVGDRNEEVDINIGVFSPRITLLYKLNEYLRFRGGYARGFRAPQAFNEDLHISSVGGEPLFVILSEDLDKELSDAFTGSINYTRNFGLTQVNFLVEGFYTMLQNPFIQVSTGAVLPNGSIIEEVRNGEGATVSGINFEAGYSPSEKLAFQVGGTIQQTAYNESQVLFEPEDLSEEIVVTDEFIRNPHVYGFFTSYYNITKSFAIDITGTYTGSMIVPRVVSESGLLDLIDTDPFFDVNVKASYDFALSNDFQLELSLGARNIFDSFQQDFDSGAERDSDFIYGPLAPRSVFVAIKIGSLN